MTPPISKAHFSHDGKRIVIAAGGEAAVWDTGTGHPVTEGLRHDDAVLEARFTPDGNRVVTASACTLRVWSVPGGRQVAEAVELMSQRTIFTRMGFVPIGPLANSPQQSPQVQISNDGSRVFACWADHGGSESSTNARASAARRVLTVWRLQTSHLVPEPLEHDLPVISAQFSLDGKRIFSASNGIAWSWDAQDGRCMTEVHTSAERVSSTDLSPDGKRFLTTSTNIAQVWITETGQPATDPMGHDGWVGTAQFSPDGKPILTASEGGTARARDARTNSISQGRSSRTYSTMRIWDTGTGRPLTKPVQLALTRILAVVRGRPEVSPDGQRIFAFGCLWDAQTGDRVGEVMSHSSTGTGLFSADAGYLLTPSQDVPLSMWDAHNGKRLLGRLSAGMGFLAISPDWSRIATAMPDDTVRICDAKTGEPLTEPLFKQGTNVFSIQFSPDGKRVLTLWQDKAQAWDAQTGQPLTEPLTCGLLAEPRSEAERILSQVPSYAMLRLPPRSAQFSPDGTRIVVCSGGLRVWNIGPLGEKHPLWLLPLAEAVTGKQLTSAGVFEPTRLNRGSVVSNIRQKLNQTPDDKDEWAAWGRWLLADPTTRTISPYSKITVPEYIKSRIKENTTNSLAEAEELAGGNADLSALVSLWREMPEQKRRADALRSEGKFAEAVPCLRQVLAARRELLDSEHADVAASLKDLADALWSQDKLAEAEPNYREALSISRKVWTNNPASIEGSVFDLAEVLQHQGKYSEVERLLGEFFAPVEQAKPENAGMLRSRGLFRARHGQWKEAAADLTQAAKLNPEEHRNWYQLAPLLIETGDLEGYRKHRAAMLARFDGTNDPPIAERTAKAFLLLPAVGADLVAASTLANWAADAGQDHAWLAYFQFGKGLAQYRQGRFAEAAAWTKKALTNPGVYDRDAQAYAVLAMAHDHLGQTNEAKAALAKASEITETKLPKLNGASPGANFNDWLIAHILTREAKGLIEGGATGETKE